MSSMPAKPRATTPQVLRALGSRSTKGAKIATTIGFVYWIATASASLR
jgi:hypothetical protein